MFRARFFTVWAGLIARPALAAELGVLAAHDEATIAGSDIVIAKKAAITDALRYAIEHVVGFAFTNTFNAEQREVGLQGGVSNAALIKGCIELASRDLVRVSGSQLEFKL